jgi:hypothetical protein
VVVVVVVIVVLVPPPLYHHNYYKFCYFISCVFSVGVILINIILVFVDKRPQYLLNMRLGGPQSQSGQFGKENFFWWELKHDSLVIQLMPHSLSWHTDILEVYSENYCSQC